MKHTQTCPHEQRIEQMLLALTGETETRELTEHLDGCEACQRRAQVINENAALEDDLHWAVEARTQTPVRVEAPLHRINEMLPDFEILGELGRGGMGVVCRARQRKLDRLVAVKVLPALLGTVRPDARARFRREAELAASLDHTNIAGVHDFGEVEGTLYYVMQLIEGRSLRTVLNEIADAGTTDIVVGGKGSSSSSRTRSPSSGVSARPIYFRKIAHWIAEVAEAMQYAHDRGIIHRDIKPSNLILAEDGRLVISDFGLACFSDSDSPSQTSGLVGTCRYMSPEQVDPGLGQVGFQSDVYSLGATLYELLTFKPMYTCTDERELLRQVVEVDPPPPSHLVPQIPRELETICLKAIAKERRHRYTNAAKMAEDLRRWLLDLPIHARRQTVTERALRFVRRRKLYVFLTTLAGVFAVAAGGLWVAYNATERIAGIAKQDARQSRIALALREARAALDGERIDDVLDYLSTGLALDPEHPGLNRLKAVVLFRTGTPDAAMEIIRQIIDRRPQDWAAHFLAAFAMRPCLPNDWTCRCIDRTGLLGPDAQDTLSLRFEHHLRAVQEWRAGQAEEFCLLACAEEDPQLALALLNSALAKNPQLSEALLLRALRYESIGQFEKMKQDALKAMELRKGGDLAYGVLGTAQYNLGQYSQAKETYNEAIHRNPGNVLWWYDRAVVRCYLGEFPDAISDANTAIGINSTYAFAYVARAKAQVGMGRIDKAMQDYDHAERLDPRIADIYVERCELYLRAGQYDLALADGNCAVKLRPAHASGYQRRAHAYIMLRDYDAALIEVEHCLGLDPDDPVSLLLKGIVLCRAGDYEDAIAALDRAIAHAPTDVRIHRNRAKAFLNLGRYQEAISDLTRWVDQGIDPALALFTRGMAYELIGEPRLALADYRAAGDVQPPVSDYADLWSLLLCRANDDATCAAQIMQDHAPLASPQTWTDRLFAFMAERIDFAALLAAATSPTEDIEAYYYGGMMALLAGRTDAAVERFKESAARNCGEALEGDFALARLRALWLADAQSACSTPANKSHP